jgi:hypothetical protein
MIGYKCPGRRGHHDAKTLRRMSTFLLLPDLLLYSSFKISFRSTFSIKLPSTVSSILQATGQTAIRKCLGRIVLVLLIGLLSQRDVE